MATQIPQPATYVFKEINVGKYKTVKRYELNEADSKKPKLSKLIKISKDQKFAKSSPCYWLEVHDGKKFIKPRVTGLFKTGCNYIYFGDIDVKRVKTHILLFKFSSNADTLTIKFFENYYTNDLNQIIHFIK
tara:strand:+ start:3724 stop:4119 length:396 start_codon:yes stop_codon:yes gene_type:complete